MGRLVKSPANQARAERKSFDEQQFLRDAGELASRLQQELHGQADSRPDDPERRHPRSEFRRDSDLSATLSDLSSTLDDVAGRDSSAPNADHGGDTAGSEPASLRLRVFAPGDDTVDAGTDSKPSSDDHSKVPQHAGAAANRESTTVSRMEARTMRDRMEREWEELEEARREFQEEQRRWADRHAQQSRQLEKQMSQVEDWKVRLAEREHELNNAARDCETHVRARIENELAEGASEARQLLSQCSSEKVKLEQQLESLRQDLDRREREHARTEAELRAQLESAEDDRTARRLQVIEECDRRMAELTEEKQTLAELRRHTEDEVAAARAAVRQEQRDWEKRLTDLRQELRDQTEAHERRMASERAELQAFVAEENAAVHAAQRELQAAEQKHQARMAAERRELDEQRAALRESVDQLQAVLQQRRHDHEQQLERERQQFAHECEQRRSELQNELEDLRRQELRRIADERSEADSMLEAAREQIQREQAAWHEQRGEEAAVLKQARAELNADREALQKELTSLESRREAAEQELRRQRDEWEQTVAAERAEQERQMARAEREFADRQQVLEQRIEQQEVELQARRERLEHEIRTMHELHERRLAEDRRDFEDQCERQREILTAEMDEYRALRDELDSERRAFQREVAEARSQIDQERQVLRRGIEQMDAQLRNLATSLASPESSGGAVTERRTSRPAARQDARETEFLDQVRYPSKLHASVPPGRAAGRLSDETQPLPDDAEPQSDGDPNQHRTTEWIGLTDAAAKNTGPHRRLQPKATPVSETAETAPHSEQRSGDEASASPEQPNAESSDGIAGDEVVVEAGREPSVTVSGGSDPADMACTGRSGEPNGEVSEAQPDGVEEEPSESPTAATLQVTSEEQRSPTGAGAGEADDADSTAVRIDAAEQSPRRQLLDRYRSQLGDLKAQLAELSALRSPDTADDSLESETASE